MFFKLKNVKVLRCMFFQTEICEYLAKISSFWPGKMGAIKQMDSVRGLRPC